MRKDTLHFMQMMLLISVTNIIAIFILVMNPSLLSVTRILLAVGLLVNLTTVLSTLIQLTSKYSNHTDND